MKVSDDKKFLCRKNAEGEVRSGQVRSAKMVKGWLTGWSSQLTSERVQRNFSVGSLCKRSGMEFLNWQHLKLANAEGEEN